MWRWRRSEFRNLRALIKMTAAMTWVPAVVHFSVWTTGASARRC
jgi:hypothetical protein